MTPGLKPFGPWDYFFFLFFLIDIENVILEVDNHSVYDKNDNLYEEKRRVGLKHVYFVMRHLHVHW